MSQCRRCPGPPPPAPPRRVRGGWPANGRALRRPRRRRPAGWGEARRPLGRPPGGRGFAVCAPPAADGGAPGWAGGRPAAGRVARAERAERGGKVGPVGQLNHPPLPPEPLPHDRKIAHVHAHEASLAAVVEGKKGECYCAVLTNTCPRPETMARWVTLLT